MKSIQNSILWVGNLSGSKLALLSFVVVASYFLFKEHQAHVVAALPYLIFLLCPLMHLFMHKGHGGHEGEGHDGKNNDS